LGNGNSIDLLQVDANEGKRLRMRIDGGRLGRHRWIHLGYGQRAAPPPRQSIRLGNGRYTFVLVSSKWMRSSERRGKIKES
jgi:hypothetical protein